MTKTARRQQLIQRAFIATVRPEPFRPGREVGVGLMRRLIAALVVFAVAVFGVSGCSGRFPWAKAPTYRQTVLPFTGLEDPEDLAVDPAGNVYVEDLHRVEVDNAFPHVTPRVIKLPAGSNTQTVLPQSVHAHLVPGTAGAVWLEDHRDPILV